jgi:hypothetical protein
VSLALDGHGPIAVHRLPDMSASELQEFVPALPSLLPTPLTPEGSIEAERQKRQNRLRQLKEMLSNDSDLNGFIRKLLDGEKEPTSLDTAFEIDEYMRALCADRIERDLPPSEWRDFALASLRQPAPPSAEATQRNGALHRDYMISWAVLLAESVGLNPTRNQAQRYKDGAAHSACSLVADELKKRGIDNCSEDAVEKIWRKYASVFRLVPVPGLSEKRPDCFSDGK